MSEQFLLRTVGGPEPGDRFIPADLYGWPLPEVLPVEGGIYRKQRESKLPPQPDDSPVLRGAEYHWEPSSMTEKRTATKVNKWESYEAVSERIVRKWREKKLRCPSGCPCIFPDDPDQFECACDGLCVSEAWNELRTALEEGGVTA